MKDSELISARERLHQRGCMADDWPDDAVAEIARLEKQLVEGPVVVRVETDVAAGVRCIAHKVDSELGAFPLELIPQESWETTI